jgi:uncharacterized Zn finger protein
MPDSVQCPKCGSRKTEWVVEYGYSVILCHACGQTTEPGARAQIARTVADMTRLVEGRDWHDRDGAEHKGAGQQ